MNYEKLAWESQQKNLSNFNIKKSSHIPCLQSNVNWLGILQDQCFITKNTIKSRMLNKNQKTFWSLKYFTKIWSRNSKTLALKKARYATNHAGESLVDKLQIQQQLINTTTYNRHSKGNKIHAGRCELTVSQPRNVHVQCLADHFLMYGSGKKSMELL